MKIQKKKHKHKQIKKEKIRIDITEVIANSIYYDKVLVLNNPNITTRTNVKNDNSVIYVVNV